MHAPLRLARHYLALSIRSQLQHRASTVMLATGQLLVTGTEFVGIYFLFERFGTLRGWSLVQVCLLYGMASMAFALAEAVGRGFDVFDRLVKSGDFDRLLLRPASTAFQVAVSELQLTRVGRLLQAAIVFGYGASGVDIDWGPASITLAVAAILGGSSLFVGLFVLRATLAFWTTESLELVNTVTHGGVETAQYPIVIYERWFRRFFTYVIPLAALSYFPVVAITGHPDPLGTPTWVLWLSPLSGPLFLLLALQAWKVGVRHYRSTGS